MDNPLLKDQKALREFRELIASTTKGLKNAQSPLELVRAIEEHLPAWEGIDADFAGVLQELRGQAYQMTMPHIRAVTSKLSDHLTINLSRIEKGLTKIPGGSA